MVRWARVALCGFGTAALSAASMSGCAQSTTAEPSGVTAGSSPDAPAGYVRLPHAVHPAVRTGIDRGPLDPTRLIANLSMAFALSPAQLQDREELKAALVDPKSPRYRKFLTPAEYAARFGAPRATIERAKSWLASQGLEVHEDSPLAARVTFSGTVATLQDAFQTEFRSYQVGRELHYAARLAPALPADLGAVVAAITNTHDFYPKPMSHMAPRPEYEPPGGKLPGFAVPDWANVYDVSPLYTTGVGGKKIDGTGVGVAIVGVAAIAQSDVDAWRSTFKLPASTITMQLVPNTGTAIGGSGGSGFEAVLDVEWSGGVAPGAAITYVFVGSKDPNVDDASYYAIENNLAPVLSESWGGCEGYYVQAGLTSSDQNLIDIYGSAANVLGITYVASSGDQGADACSSDPTAPSGLWVGVPAAYPGLTAVGGTQFATGSVSGSPYFTAYSAAETTWDESDVPPNVGASVGGISALFSRPSYQMGLANCAVVGSLPVSGLTAATQRQVPDVAFTAAAGGSGTIPDLMECTIKNGDCSPGGGAARFSAGGGTSFAAPAFAGVVALMLQAAGGRLGNINPMLYTLATTTPAAFHDIATGTNEVVCTAADTGCPAGGLYGFAATKGYDCTTGLGSLDVYNAVAAIAGEVPTTTQLAIAPMSTTEGTPVAFTATVTVPTPNASPLGGVVTFAFESYDQDAGPDLSWTLGTGTIGGGTTAGGTATFTGVVPPGLVKPGMQWVNVYAAFGGDATHLPSVSPEVMLSFAPLSFAIVPAAPTTMPLGKIAFSTSGGAAPIKWFTGTDTTCNMPTGMTQPTCATIDEATGAYVAGPVAGTTQIQAIDANGEEVYTTVTVVCTPATACPAGQNCGAAPDGCGNMIACGTCTAPETCGGGGTATLCGCTPACPSGATCGMASNGCGGMMDCGTCSAGQACTNNQCVGGGTGGAGGSASSTSSSASSSSTTTSSGSTGGEPTTSSSSSGSSGADVANKGGCSCTTASDPVGGPRSSLSAFGLLALASVLRSRKRGLAPCL